MGSVKAGTVVETAVVAGSVAGVVLRRVAAAGAMLTAMHGAVVGDEKKSAPKRTKSELAAEETRAEMWSQAWPHARR